MYYYELSDITFLVNFLKNKGKIKIQDLNTISSDLKHVRCESNLQEHFYFNRITKLWNKMPEIELNSTKSCGQTSSTLVGTMYAHFILNVHALGVTLISTYVHVHRIFFFLLSLLVL